MSDFNDFLKSNFKKILDQQSSRVVQDFAGKNSPENLIAKLISEINATTIDFLETYHNWLTSNYDIVPKEK